MSVCIYSVFIRCFHIYLFIMYFFVVDIARELLVHLWFMSQYIKSGFVMIFSSEIFKYYMYHFLHKQLYTL